MLLFQGGFSGRTLKGFNNFSSGEHTGYKKASEYIRIMIESHTVLQRNDEINFTSMCGEIVMMSSDQSEFYGLDDIATDIWNRLEEKKTVQELIAELCAAYGIEEEQCRTDSLPFLDELADKKLLFIS